MGGIAPDANGVFWIPESALSSGQRNWVSVRKESAAGEVYSNVVVVNYNANLTSSAVNQVRSVSVSRSGTDVIIRWKVLQENGKTLRVYFHQSGAGEPVLLTPEGLVSGTTQYLLQDQALALSCGYFDVTQTSSSGSSETGPSPSVALPPSGPMGASKIHQACVADDGGDPFEDAPEAPAVSTKHIATNFHHRDHLGSLRVVTDSVGWKLDAHDYYPFGREIEAIQRDLSAGSVSRFTGHERDLQTGLDYMVMRSKSSNFPFFTRPDLVDAARLAAPNTWNTFAYVEGNPVNRVDPLGLLPPVVNTCADNPTDPSCNSTVDWGSGGYGSYEFGRYFPRSHFFDGMGGSEGFNALYTRDQEYIFEGERCFTRWDTLDGPVTEHACTIRDFGFVAFNATGPELTSFERLAMTFDPILNSPAGNAASQIAIGLGDGVSFPLLGGTYALRGAFDANQNVATGSGYYWAGAAAGVGIDVYGYLVGGELVLGPNFRIAPWGNRTGDPFGEFPHYHRRFPGDGGGIGRHRPWQPAPPGQPWWTRF